MPLSPTGENDRAAARFGGSRATSVPHLWQIFFDASTGDDEWRELQGWEKVEEAFLRGEDHYAYVQDGRKFAIDLRLKGQGYSTRVNETKGWRIVRRMPVAGRRSPHQACRSASADGDADERARPLSAGLTDRVRAAEWKAQAAREALRAALRRDQPGQAERAERKLCGDDRERRARARRGSAPVEQQAHAERERAEREARDRALRQDRERAEKERAERERAEKERAEREARERTNREREARTRAREASRSGAAAGRAVLRGALAEIDAVRLELEAHHEEGEAAKRARFKKLQMVWHPDKNPDKTEVATKVFQYLQEKKVWFCG